jgi:hypothetical protein
MSAGSLLSAPHKTEALSRTRDHPDRNGLCARFKAKGRGEEGRSYAEWPALGSPARGQ